MELPDDVLDVICDALREAADYRAALAHSCPRQCDERGAECEDCWPHWDAAARYEQLADQLDDERGSAGPMGRREQTVEIRGGLL